MKKVIIILSTILVVLVAAIFIVPQMVDINNYKEQITQQVKQTTGKEVVIQGGIHFNIFPNIELELNNVKIVDDVIDSNDNLVEAKKATIDLELFPLFKGNINVTSIEFNNPKINLIATKNNVKNWEITKNTEITADSDTLPQDTEILEENLETGIAIPLFKKIIIQNGVLNYQDLTSETKINVSNLNLDTSYTGNLESISLSGKLNNLGDDKGIFSVKGEYTIGDGKFTFHNVKTKFDNIEGIIGLELNTNSLIPSFNLDGDFSEINLNEYITAADSQAKKNQENLKKSGSTTNSNNSLNASSTENWDSEKFDTELLRQLNFNVNLRCKGLAYDNYKLGTVILSSHLDHGNLLINLKKIEAYEGVISGKYSIDITSAIPRTNANLKIDNIDISKIRIKELEDQKLEGKISFSTELHSQGSSEQAIINNLKGNGNLHITEGEFVVSAIEDFLKFLNFPVNAYVVENVPLLKTAKSPFEQNIFESLDATFNINNGLLSNSDLKIKGSKMSLGGKGKINIVNQFIDYYQITPEIKEGTKITLIDTLLQNPFTIKGPISHPSITPNVANIIEKVITEPTQTQEMIDQLKEEIKTITDETPGKIEDDIKNIENLIKGF